MDLSRGLGGIREPLQEAFGEVLAGGRFVLGPQVRAFEEEFAAALGVQHAVGVASGTDALEIALRALDVGPGDEVVTQANTCIPTVAAIERAGARPVLCDVQEHTGALDPESLADAMTERTRCVIAVHLYGHMADVDAIAQIAGAAPVLEDCAQAQLATDGGRTAGTIGTIGAFSFYPTKNLGALGDGGAVVTDDAEIAGRLRRIRQYGEARRYELVETGVNSRLDELQAAFLRVRLRGLVSATERRQVIAAMYEQALEGTHVRPLTTRTGTRHARHLFVVVVPDRDAFQATLADAGVATLVHYPRPVHRYAPYAALAQRVPLSVSEWLSAHVVSLPLYPELTDAEVEHVAVTAQVAARSQIPQRDRSRRSRR